ncbi:MAG: two-component system repressor protein LuxO [Paracoccaceae bacterium]|jgi:two-component system repressor protein LuxO
MTADTDTEAQMPGARSTRTKAPILLVEDTSVLAKTYIQYLRNEPYDITHVVNGRDAIEHLRHHVPRAILLDLQLPDISGMDVLAFVREQEIPCPVVMITAHGSINVAVDAMKAGAFDFVVKPFAAERIIVTLGNAVERQKLEDLVESYRQEIDRDGFHQIIGTAPSMQAVYRIIENAADSKASIFVKGESGTGKEVTAEAIHRQSKRRNMPFVALNCAAIAKDLMESEIFGHVKGAFTSAINDREGAAAQANGGTLFLDEICEMDISLQAKLLRFIQTETFQKVGGSTLEQVDVRFVCATNRNPFTEVQNGNFREDLYYRLHVIPIDLPPLRDRGDDMLEIARHFLTRYAQEEGKAFTGFTDAAEDIILAFDWPGNVREMQNVMRQIVVLNDGEVVDPDMLPPPLNENSPAPATMRPAAPKPATATDPAGTPVAADDHKTHSVSDSGPAGNQDMAHLAGQIRPMADIEREVIESAIEQCNGNIRKAAALLGISAPTIYRKKAVWDGA